MWMSVPVAPQITVLWQVPGKETASSGQTGYRCWKHFENQCSTNRLLSLHMLIRWCFATVSLPCRFILWLCEDSRQFVWRTFVFCFLFLLFVVEAALLSSYTHFFSISNWRWLTSKGKPTWRSPVLNFSHISKCVLSVFCFIGFFLHVYFIPQFLDILRSLGLHVRSSSPLTPESASSESKSESR